MSSVETDRVRVIWKAKPDFNGAAWPFGAVYTRGVSSPVLRFMVAPRVKALRHAYALACPECATPEDSGKGPAEQAHATGCSLAPLAPPAPALEQAPQPVLSALPAEVALAEAPVIAAQVQAAVNAPASLGTVDVRPLVRPAAQQKGRRA